MKTKFYLTIIALFAIVVSKAQQELPIGVSKDWYSQSAAGIEKLNYNFIKRAHSFTSANINQQLAFSIYPKGYSVSNKKQNWSAEFLINEIQSTTAISQNGSQLNFHTPSMDVEYINNEEGLRQNFIVHQKPAGKNPLRISIQINTSLQSALTSTNTLVLHTPGNRKDVKMIYDGLKVWDANKQQLAATMTLDETNNQLNITVNDAMATYPVTIDPINRIPEWSTSANGVLPALLTNLQLQVETTYGYTVAGLGDINGDGYDDVAISAPTMADVITGTGSLTGVGAVFIYLGSATGLKNTPDKILQPTTAVDGALFGYSVDAGDITGDGKNDIVISAPMDSYQTTASSLLGPTTVSVRAGKVYIYNSENLFSAPNPTPFLELKLQGATHFKKGLTALLGNTTFNALYGFSVAVTKDLNGDNKADIIIGSPAYVGVDLLAVQNGAAFIYYSNNLSTTTPAQLNPPDMSLLGISGLPLANTKGLLFGYSVDGAGDFDKDGNPDVVVGAPAGVDLSSLGGIFSGQVLGGSAYVFYGNGASINTTATVKLQASSSGLLSSAANLFGFKVKGVENVNGNKNGNILIGAPGGSLITNALSSLEVKAGEVHVFKQKNPGVTGTFTSTQTLSSPRASSILSILTGQTINLSILYGASIDNMMDVNCDNIADIIIGEPLSTAVPLIGADVVGGAAYIYLGRADGSYSTTPYWDLYTEASPLLGVNATSLLGYSVAGAGHTKGSGSGVRSLVGGPTNALDFGTGLLNLNNTISTTLDFAVDNNGLGKSYSFTFSNCNVTLPVTLLSFKGQAVNKTVPLNWVATAEINFSHYELQRSADGVHYETIAVVMAKNEQQTEYAYTDKNPFNGVNYYRLKMIDNDKKYTFSSIVIVRFQDKAAVDITVAPNPVQQDINIKITGLPTGTYAIAINNAAGQIISTKSVAVTSDMEKFTMQRKGGMVSGVYWVTILDAMGQPVKSIRILLQ